MQSGRFALLVLLTALVSTPSYSREMEHVLVLGTNTQEKYIIENGLLKIALSNEYLEHKYDKKKDVWQYVKPCRSRKKETHKK